MDQYLTCHYFFGSLSFFGSKVIGLTSSASYSGLCSSLGLARCLTLRGSEAPLPIGPRFLRIGGAESAGVTARAESAGGAGVAFHVLLNGQSPIE